MTKRSNQVKARDVAIPIGLLILLIVVIIATVEIGIQQCWQIPGIGSVGLGGVQPECGGGGGSTTYTYCLTTGSNVVCTVGTSTGGGELIPIGQVAFKMQLVAGFTDGSNQTISSVGSLPGLDVFQVGGKNVRDVTARTLVGFVSANPLPSTAIADIKANVTLYNEKTTLAVWRTYEYTSGFVDNGTTALVLLPDFTVTPQTVYSDVCATLTNGTINCNTVGGGAPAPRRVDWSVAATVTITGLSVIPQTFTGSTVSSADFSTVIQGCTNCGTTPSPTILGTITGNGAIIRDSTCSTCDETHISVQQGVPLAGGCIELLPLFCIVPSNTVGGAGIIGTPEHVTGRDGAQSNVQGGQTGGNANTGNAPGTTAREHLVSLLPPYYVPLDLGNGSWMFLNPWAALFFAVIYIAFTFGVLMLVILYRRLGRPR